MGTTASLTLPVCVRRGHKDWLRGVNTHKDGQQTALASFDFYRCVGPIAR